MKVKILKPSSDIVGMEFEINDYTIHLTHLRFKIKNKGFFYDDDCVITELPESFCVKLCDDPIKWGKYIQWLNKTYKTDFCGRLFNFNNPSDKPYYGIIDNEGWGIKLPFGTEIHIDDIIKHIEYIESQQHIKGGEQFSKESQLTIKEEFDLTTNEGRLAYVKKHGVGLIYANGKWAEIIKEENKMETQKLSRQGLKEIYSVACDEWQGKLKSFGYRNPLEDYIDLTEEEVNEMFFASNDKQKSILSKYLKQDDGSVDLTKTTVGQVNDIWLDGESIIQVRNRGEYKDKSFWLKNIFNWEIKTDSKGLLCLIPTKKK